MSQSSLPEDLTDAENKLEWAARREEFADYRARNEKFDKPANGANWGSERTIRAEVIYALAVGDNSQVHAKGVQIYGAKIVGPLDMEGANIPHPFVLFDCFIGEPITLRNADALSVNLDGSRVAGIVADGLRTRGDVFLRDDFHATGEVRLPGAAIGGDLDCFGGTFKNAEGVALYADRAAVEGAVFLHKGFHAKGEVRLLGAKIGRDLNCSGGTFENAEGEALNAAGARVEGHVFLTSMPQPEGGLGFHAKGEVRLVGAKIGGKLACWGGKFENADGTALNLEGATVTATFFLSEFASPPAGVVDLRSAHVGYLVDDEKSWPQDEGNLKLDEFVYGRLAGYAPWQARDRLRWLSLLPGFWPQPYEQLVRVLREMGQEQDAREVAIAKQVQVRKRGSPGFWGWARSLFLGFTIAHGYKGGRAFAWLVLVWLLGTGMFWLA